MTGDRIRAEARNAGLTDTDIDRAQTWRDVVRWIDGMRTAAPSNPPQHRYDGPDLSHDDLVGWDIGDQD